MSRSAEEEDLVLEQLLQRYFEAAEVGTPPPLAELCAEHPDLLPAVASMLGDEPPETARGVEDPLLGTRLGGRYRMLDRLGAGGMGLVYLGRDETLDREVAVKVLEDIFQGIPERIERFRREAKALAALENPHIVAVHDFDLSSNPPYLVMDRIRGFDLGHFLAELRDITASGRMPERFEIQTAAARLAGVDASELGPLFDMSWAELTARLVEQMCGGLAQAHAAGIVHRDIKPSNFMLDAEGRLRLLDFGLARREVDEGLTRSEASVGTPIYMSPEQVESKDATVLSDVYSLGATLYQCLTLQQPFSGRGRELQNQILYEEPTPPRLLRARVPHDLEAICLTAMHKDPKRRYQSVREVGDEIRRFLSYEPVLARPRILPAPLRSLVGTWRRYRPPRAVMIGGLAVIATVIVVTSLFVGEGISSAANKLRLEYEALRPRISPTLGLGGTREERLQAKTRARDLAVLDRLLELEPTDVEARFLRYYSHLEDPKLADGPAAKSDLGKLKSAIPESVLSALQKAFELLRDRNSYAKGKIAAADAAWESLDSLPKANGSLAALISRLRITAAFESLQFWKAMELAIAEAGRGGITAFTSFSQALAQLGMKRDDKNIAELLQSVLEQCPDHAQAYQLLASYYHRAGELELAEKAILKARELLPSHTSFINRYADILRDQRRFAEAEKVLREYPERMRAERDLEIAVLRLVEADSQAGSRRQELLGQAMAIVRDLEAQGQQALGRLWRNVANTKVAVQQSMDGSARDRASFYTELLETDVRDPHLLGNAGKALVESTRTRSFGRVCLRLALLEDRSRDDLLRRLALSHLDDQPRRGLMAFIEFRPGQLPGDEDRQIIERLLAALPASARATWRDRLRRAGILPAEQKTR